MHAGRDDTRWDWADLARVAARVAAAVTEPLSARGYRVWVVGGLLRDAALGVLALDPTRAEAWDVDLATDAPPDAIDELMAEWPQPSEAVSRLGSYRWRTDSGGELALTILRDESSSAYRDARHPDDVTFVAALEPDAARRDFTVNAMYLQLPGGPLRDPLERAVQDGESRVLRTIGDPRVRLVEDPVRMLRALRFASGCGLMIDEATEAVLREQGSDALHRLTGGRVLRELESGLRRDGRVALWRRVAELGWASVLLPEHDATPGAGAVVEASLDRFVAAPARSSLWLALTAPLGLRAAESLLQRASLPRQVTDVVGRARRLLRAAVDGGEAPAFVARVGAHADDPVFDVATSVASENAQADRIRVWQMTHRVATEFSGRDLIAAGLEPGPAVGAALREFRERLLAAGAMDIETARSVLTAVARRHQGRPDTGR